MKKISLNPFSGIIETIKYPFARVLRTSFLNKLGDTYRVIAGSLPMDYPKSHPGLLDYMTLGVFYGLLLALQLSMDKMEESAFARAVFMPLVLLNIPALALRIISGTLLTLLAAPVVYAVHRLGRILGRKTIEEFLDEEVEIHGNKIITMREALQRPGFQLENLYPQKLRNSAGGQHRIGFFKEPYIEIIPMVWAIEGALSNPHEPLFIITGEPESLSHEIEVFNKLNLAGGIIGV